MNKWVTVPQSIAQNIPPSIQKVRGMSIQVHVSPFDIPQAIRGRYDDASRRFVIELQYMGKERTEIRELSPQVILLVGRRTGRIYEIQVDVHSENIGAIRIQLMNSAAQVPDSNSPDARRRVQQYHVAGEALLATESEVARQLSESHSYAS